MATLDQERLLEDVTCPTCREVPRTGGLFHCCLGHNICEGCFGRISGEADGISCPQCKGQYLILEGGLPQRNRIADTILDKLVLKCRSNLQFF